MVRQRTKEIEGKTVLDHEGGNRFYHKHLSPKARKQKKNKRKQRKLSQGRKRR
jgi:hypothetical protein